MEQLGNQHKIIPSSWACTVFPLSSFKVPLAGKNIEKCDMKFVTETFAPPYLWHNTLETVILSSQLHKKYIYIVTHINPYLILIVIIISSNVIRLTWSGNQVEDYITQNCLERNQDADHARILNIRE